MTKQKKEQRAMSEAVLTFADLQNRKHWPYSRVTTWRMIREGRFPKPFQSGRRRAEPMARKHRG